MMQPTTKKLRPSTTQIARSVATYNITRMMLKNSSAVPRSFSKTRTPMQASAAMMIGPRSRARGSSTLRNFLPATMNRSRFDTRNEAKKIISRIFANSPGWIEKNGSLSHTFAPFTSERLDGSMAGSASAKIPIRPAV